MNNNNENIEKLRAEKKRREEELSHLLLNGDTSEATNNIKWIELAEKVINRETGKPKFYAAVVIAFVVLLVIGMSFTQSIPASDIQAEINASGFIASLNDTWQLSQSLLANGVTISKIGEVHTLDRIIHFEDGDEITAEGSGVQINNLRFSRNSTVEIKSTLNETLIYLLEGSLEGNLLIREGFLTVEEERYPVKQSSIGPPMMYKFFSDTVSRYSDPLVMRMSNNLEFLLEDIPFDTLKFTEEMPPNSGKFITTIDSGEIYFDETQTSFTLQGFENLLLVNTDLRSIAIGKKGGFIHLKFIGRVSELNLVEGTHSASTNLKPSYFEYFYNNRPLTLFWGILVSIGSLLWSIRNTLLSH